MTDALLDLGGYVEGLDESGDGVGGDFLIGASELLESLIGVGVAHRAQDGLDGFGHHSPVVLQVAVEGLLVKEQLAQTFLEGGKRDEGVGDGHTDVAAHGAVGEVALHTADGQLVAQVLEDGVGQTQIALGILEVDGIDLMWHGTGADLAGFDFLLEIFHGDICPNIAAEVDEDDVDALASIEPGCHHVIILNLGGELLALKSQVVFHEIVAEGAPVDLRAQGSFIGFLLKTFINYVYNKEDVCENFKVNVQSSV